jgi:hypothetical protein
MPVQGWCPDPYGSHEDRWFSEGEPTRLVRDQGTESYDEPPRGQLPLSPVGREPPEGRLPPYPPGPAGKQERPAWAGSGWPWWTVCLPGLPAIAISCFLAFVAAVASALSCFDTCNPRAEARASDAAGQAFIIAIVTFALLVAGLAAPARRRVFTAALWVALPAALVPVFEFYLLD